MAIFTTHNPTMEEKFIKNINLEIEIIENIINAYKRWLDKSKEPLREYMNRKLEKYRKHAGSKFVGTEAIRSKKRKYYDLMYNYSNLNELNWVNLDRFTYNEVCRNRKIDQKKHRYAKQGYLDQFIIVLKKLRDSIINNQIQSLIDKIKEIYFIESIDDSESIKLIFEKAKKWRDLLISLIVLPNSINDSTEIPFLTNQSNQGIFSMINLLNGTDTKPLDNFKEYGKYLIPGISCDELFNEWNGLSYQCSYEKIFELLGFEKDETSNRFFPNQNPYNCNISLISLLKENNLCELKSIEDRADLSKVNFILNSYSLHFIYYFIVLKNLNSNLISITSIGWISYVFSRIIYNYFKFDLINDNNPLIHLMEESDLRDKIFKPFWKIISSKLGIPRLDKITIRSEWLQIFPKEIDKNMNEIINYITKKDT